MAKTETAENSKPKSRMSITEEDKRVYTSLEEAQKNQPDGKPNWFLFQVTDPNGRMRWVWAGGYHQALWFSAVDADHYHVIAVEDAPTKSEVSGMLAALSKEDRAALLKEYGSKK